MNILHLTLKKQWYDMIESGIKKEEYREMKPYWHKRLLNRKMPYTHIQFRNGYNPDSPTMQIEFKGLMSGLGIVEWGAPEAQEVYILKLGDIVK